MTRTRRNSRLSRVSQIVVAALVLFAPVLVATAPASSAPVVAQTIANIDNLSRASVRSSYLNTLKPALSVPVGWTGNTAGCNTGAPSAAAQQATLTAVNWYREMAGVSPVSFDAGLSSKAQQAALIMEAQWGLSHNPPSNWKCWTQTGAHAAGSSNLALGVSGANAIQGYMEDPGAGNEPVGHRRWILYPPQTTMGSGSTSWANALYVFAQTGARPATPSLMPWPTAGFFPSPEEPGGRWSISFNTFDYQSSAFNNATVQVTRDGQAVSVSQKPQAFGYGDPTLVWEMDVPTVSGGPDQTYHVKITGISAPGLPSTYEYDVKLFDPDLNTPSPPSEVTAVAGNGSATVSWSTPASNGGSPVTGYTVTASPGGASCSTAGVRTCVVTGLTDGQAYTFTVAASNAVGAGEASVPTDPVIPHPPMPPGSPTGVVGAPRDGGVSVSWQAPQDDGGSAISGYTVTSNPDGSTCTTTGATSCVVAGLTNGTPYSFTVTATNAAGTSAASPASEPTVPSAETPSDPGSFHPMPPVRIIDSRPASKVGPYTSPWGHGTSRNITVAGMAGVPADATAVVLNVTGVGATANTYLTIWPKGQTKPTASNLNLPPGDTRPTLVMAKVGSDKSISLYNHAGNTDAVIDVMGWYGPGSDASYFNELPPKRIWDTRPAPENVGQLGKIGQGQTKTLTVTGNGVPSDATAVVMNVTAVSPSATTYVTAWPTGQTKPTASNLNAPVGDVRPNLVIAKVGTDGKVSFYNHAGSTDLVVDVVGYFSTTGTQFSGMTPVRIWDTRPAPENVGLLGKLGHSTFKSITVAGINGVPADAKAVVVNITGVTPSYSTYLTAWPTGVTRPTASNLNLTPGSIIPNLAVVKVGAGGKISIYNNAGSTDVVVDIVGWYS